MKSPWTELFDEPKLLYWLNISSAKKLRAKLTHIEQSVLHQQHAASIRQVVGIISFRLAAQYCQLLGHKCLVNVVDRVKVYILVIPSPLPSARRTEHR